MTKPLELLTELIERASGLADGSANDDAFLSWREECINVLRTLIGREHDITREFVTMRFRLHPRLVKRKEVELSRAVLGDVSVDQQHFFRERIHDAVEILTTARLFCMGPGPP